MTAVLPLRAPICGLHLRRDEGIFRQVRCPGDRHDPRPLRGITLRGDLQQLLLGDEAGVGHQALIDLTQLRHPQGGVGDETTVLLRLLPGQQQPLQHPVQGKIAQLHLVDQ